MKKNDFDNKQYRQVILELTTASWAEFKELNVDELFSHYKHAGVNRFIPVTKCAFGLCYYNTTIGMKHPGLGKRDLLKEFLVAGKKYGIEVVPLICVTWDYYLNKEHPDWLQIDSNGEKCIINVISQDEKDIIDAFYYPCINTEYGDYYYSIIKEVLQYDGISGILSDVLFNDSYKLTCYCKGCLKKYREEVGKEMPTKIDWFDPDFIQFVKWRYKNLLDYQKGIRDIIKNHNPGLFFEDNYFGDCGSGNLYYNWRTGHTAEGGAENLDRVYCEAYASVWGYGYFTMLPKYIRGASGGKPVDITTHRYLAGWDYITKPKEMLKFELSTFAANGASVCIIDVLYAGGKLEPKYENLKYAYDEIKAKEKYIYNKDTLPYLGIYFSQNSKDFYGRGDNDKYEPGFLGGFQIAVDLHLPVDIIFDRDLTIEKLKNYKILYIPNAVCMSESQIKVIEEYVSNGGNLIVTYKTSLADEDGFIKNNFGLSNLLGVNYIKESDFEIGYASIPEDSIIYDESINNPLLIRRDPPLFISNLDKVVLSYLMNPVSKSNFRHSLGITPPDPNIVPEKPLIIYNKYGKGKVVYIGANLEKDYATFGHPYDREIVRLIIEKVFEESPPIRIKAPLSVDTTFFKEDNKYIINLINFHTNRRSETTTLAPKMLVPIIEELIPIYDIEIKTSFKVKKAYIVPEKTELEIKNEEGASSFILPKLDLWSTVVIEK